VIFSGVAFEDCANPKGPIRATMIQRTSVENWGRDGIAMTLPYLLADPRFVRGAALIGSCRLCSVIALHLRVSTVALGQLTLHSKGGLNAGARLTSGLKMPSTIDYFGRARARADHCCYQPGVRQHLALVPPFNRLVCAIFVRKCRPQRSRKR
jgi:hypothetical protein